MWTLRWVRAMSTKSPLEQVERAAAGGLVLAALLMIGCGGKRGETEPVFSVTGKVLVDGEPAAGALVIFHRQETGADAANPRGFVLENGTFELTTTSKNDLNRKQQQRTLLGSKVATNNAVEASKKFAKTSTQEGFN